MSEEKLVKKHLFALFLKDKKTEKFIRIRKATELNRAMNPVTEEYDYIADEFPTTEVTGYKPSEPVSVKAFKGSEDFDLLYEIYKNRSIGADAHYDVLTVYFFDEYSASGKTYYYAEYEDSTLTIDSWDVSGTSLSANIAHNGTPKKGYVEIVNKQPVFVEGDIPSDAESTYFANVAEFIAAAEQVSTGVSYKDSESVSHDDGVTYAYGGVTYLYDGEGLYTGNVESDVWTSLTAVDVTTIAK